MFRIWIFLVTFFFSMGARADLVDAMNSVCSIEQNGTGFVYADDKDNYWIMSAAHVIKERTEVKVCFYIDGVKTREHTATVHNLKWSKHLSQADDTAVRDLAIMFLSKKDFAKGEPRPTVIPLASKSDLKAKDAVCTCGCPRVGWPTTFHTRVKTTRENLFTLTPRVIGGRSGSPVFSRNGKQVVGVIIWGHDGLGRSTAINVQGIQAHSLFGKKMPPEIDPEVLERPPNKGPELEPKASLTLIEEYSIV